MHISISEVKMKYVRFKTKSEIIRYGILEDNERIRALESTPYEEMRLTDDYYDIEGVDLICPADFSKAVCIGLNYRDHAEELNLEIPSSPVVFIKPSTCQLGQGEDIIYPEMCSRLDYEAELAVVIGKRCHNIAESEADDYILGYTIANDVTARDLQPINGQWTISKSFDTFLPLGPYISDEVNPDDLYIASKVNGEIKQESRTSNLIFKVPYLVSYISKVMTLLPGDVIITGTPGGISGMNDGDIVEIMIEGLGVLRNKISKVAK